jgi:polygalacturonase
MTVSANSRRREYDWNGVATVFDGPMAFDASHIEGFYRTADGVVTPIAASSLTISRLGRPASRVEVFGPAIPVGARLILLRQMPYTQEVDIGNLGAFHAKSVEDADDAQVMQIQQLADGVSRSFRLSDTAATGIDFTLDTPTPSALIGWDQDGNRLVSYSPEQFVTTATAGVPFVVNVAAGQSDVDLVGLKTPWSPQGVFYNGIFQEPTAYTRTGAGIKFLEPLPVAGTVAVVAVFGGPTNVTEADMLTYTPVAPGGTTRPVQEALDEVLSVRGFGATGNGAADDKEAIRKAVAEVTRLGGGRVFLPRGTYRVGDAAGSQIVVTSNTMIYGEPGTVIYFDDNPAVAVDPSSTNRLFFLSDTVGVTLQGIEFAGSVLQYDSPTANAKQLIGGMRNKRVTVQNCTFRNLRHMAISLGATEGAVVNGNVFENLGRDAARFTHSHNVTITGNVFRNVSDDAVALHSRDTGYTIPVPSGHVVSGNVFENSQGIRALGAKGLTVSGNTFRRCFSHALHVEQGWSGAEGNTPQFAINVTGNTILDTLQINTSVLTPIGIISIQSAARSAGAETNDPGVNAIPYAFNYNNETDVGGVNPGLANVSITNNVIARTLPSVAAFSTWGYGQFFDHRNAGSFWADPAIADANFGLHAIYIEGPADGVLIANNNISGLSPDFHAFHFDVNGSANGLDLNNVVIQGNVVRDCPGHAVFASFTGTAGVARNMTVQGNTFDLDPFFRHSGHAADNTWASGGAVRAVTSTAGVGVVLTGNTCKHMGQVFSAGENPGSYYEGNFLWSQPTAAGNNAANKGIRVVDAAQVNVIYDGDPTSATFGQITTFPAYAGSAVPSTGFYVAGHVVRRTTPTIAGSAASRYVIHGWIRITTGSAHVAGTDWAEQRTLTGT